MPFYSKHDWINEIPTIREKGLGGYSMAALAEIYGISRQRMKQIIDKHIPDWHQNLGNAARKNHSARLHFKKWGEREDTALYREQRLKFTNKKSNAKRLGHEWSISFGDLTWPTHCPMLGIELDYFAEKIQDSCVSFDRINNNKGYVEGNVQLLSWRANRIKNDGTASEHRKIADYLEKQENNT